MWVVYAVVGVIGGRWWLRIGLRRAKCVYDAWRVEHGWKVAHGVANPGADRLLDWTLVALLVPLGPLVPRCRRRSVLVALHLLLLLIFGTAPHVPHLPITPTTVRPVPAFRVYPVTLDNNTTIRKV